MRDPAGNDREPLTEGRCPARHSTEGFSFQCEREYGHGGAHNATLDDPDYDPNFTYVVSWWPRQESS